MTSELVIKNERVILDASTVINLYATKRMTEIVRAVPAQCAVSTYVKQREALAVYEGAGIEGERKRIPIDLEHMIANKLLYLCDHNLSSITNRIVELAGEGIRGMGEKICAAIAIEYDWAVALDDYSATVKLNRLMPGMQTITSLDILKYWYDQEDVSVSELNEVLLNLQLRGNYVISKKHHLFYWEKKYLEIT